MNQQATFRTPRQKAREIASQILYRYENANESISTPEAKNEFKIHFEHFEKHTSILPPEAREFCERLVVETLTKLSFIDDMIKKHAANWKIERIAATDKAFLRMGTAELLYFKDVPAKVTLEEVIELSKDFGESDTPSFINGLLDPISKEPESLQGKVESV